MSKEKQTPARPANDPRLIARWARRYAKSRTVSFLVQWVFIVLMVVAIGMATQYTNWAHREHRMGALYASVGVMMLAFLGLAWFCVSPRGGDVIWRITQWLYRGEGYVSDDDEAPPAPWWITALSGGLVVYHLLGALLVTFSKLPLGAMQPFSAAYMVPYIAIMILYQRLGFWAWFWPLLYGIHALLLAFTSLPIRFTDDLQLLNLAVPVFGYGLVSILIGHVYSRFALHRLKVLARGGLDAAPEDAGE